MTCRVRGALSAALLSLLLPSLVRAQAPPAAIIRLTPQQASSFAPAFAALAEQAQVTVVAEDQPLHTALTPRALARLRLNKASRCPRCCPGWRRPTTTTCSLPAKRSC